MSSGSGATSGFTASRQERRAGGDDWQSVQLFRSGRKIAGRSKDGQDRNEEAKKQERSIAMKRTTKKKTTKVDLAKTQSLVSQC